MRGGWGAFVTFAKSNKRGYLGGLFFSGKARKERFSFHEKHKRDGFNATFCGVPQGPKIPKDVFTLLFASAKSNQKQTEGLGPLDSRGTVQSLKAVLDTESYNFYKKYACVEL